MSHLILIKYVVRKIWQFGIIVDTIFEFTMFHYFIITNFPKLALTVLKKINLSCTFYYPNMLKLSALCISNCSKKNQYVNIISQILLRYGPFHALSSKTTSLKFQQQWEQSQNILCVIWCMGLPPLYHTGF